MRHFVGLFGLACSAIVISVAARYGYTLSSNDMDGYIWAFIFGAVTFAGLGGHMVGVRLWRYRKRIFALIIFSAASFALVISLSNSLGAMAGRMNTAAADRTKTSDAVKDARRDLNRAQSELEGLKFKPTDQAAVDAAQKQAKAATEAKEAECSRVRGPRCRDKETAENQALAEFKTASDNKAATDRAHELDNEIKALKETIGKAGPVLEANSAGSALARLFNLPNDEKSAAQLSTYQQLAMAIVIEIIIMLSLITYEVMTEHERESMPKPAAAFVSMAPAEMPIEIEPDQPAAIAAPIEEPKKLAIEPPAKEPQKPVEPPFMIEALSIEDEPKAFPVPSRPRLVASRPDPVGSVPGILTEIMEPAPRGKVEMRLIFNAYSEACRAQGKRPVPANEFAAALAELCKAAGIETEIIGKTVYLLKVRLKKSGKEANARQP